MKTITLGSDVMVSDPCYDVPTWCQTRLRNVKPGKYHTFHKMVSINGRGERTSSIVVVHEDHIDDYLKWECIDEIGVDSGQAGIFSFETYRNDDVNVNPPEYDFNFHIMEEGDKWYGDICKFTLSEDSHGVYENGFVSSSGYGDGSYGLYTSTIRDEVVGIMIDFAVENGLNKNWFRKQLTY
jgi:hypothetical protein